MSKTDPEPWLRATLAGVGAHVMPLFFTFTQVREDLATNTAGLTREQLWRRVGPCSLGFHLKHLAGSVDRLTAYLFEESLTPQQLSQLDSESLPEEDLPELLARIEASLRGCEERLRTLAPESLLLPRTVGRQALPTTVIGLIVHLAEHTQRHLGQAITISQAVRKLS